MHTYVTVACYLDMLASLDHMQLCTFDQCKDYMQSENESLHTCMSTGKDL